MTAAKRLDGVDLRVGIPDARTARTAAALGTDQAEAAERAVHLLEDFAGGPGLLAAAGATARLVQAGPASEVVIQLRPVRLTRLGPGWLGYHSDRTHRLRIAEQWTANQRIMTATLTARLDAAVPALTGSDGSRPADGLLSARQRDFLASGTGLVIEDDRLALFGPIRERVWKLRRYDLDFLLRRWTARPAGQGAALDVIDLERPSSAADAPFLFPALRSVAHRQGIDTGEDFAPVVIRAVAAWASARRR